MTTQVSGTPEDVARVWVSTFGSALQGELGDEALHQLFDDDSHWRDLVALTWNVRQISGRSGVVNRLTSTAEWARPRNFRLAEGYSPPAKQTRIGRDVVEAFFEFDTVYGSALGLVRLSMNETDDSTSRAWMLLTQIHSVSGAPSVWGGERPNGVGYDKANGRITWSKLREWKQAFADRDPEVLVVGGGQAGVMLSAHLNRLGVDNLLVDDREQVGDNWRTRYDSLQLHNQTPVVQFPYLPFPTVFPEYIPKDKLANWFQDYVDALEINYWTRSRLVRARYHDAVGRWDVTLDQDPGGSRILHPKHIVITTGGTGVVPNIPALSGLGTFAGSVLHSKDFTSGRDYAGQRVLVVGVGTSAHDIAYDLTVHGAESVTMLQRGSVTVTSLESANDLFGMYSLDLPIHEVDTILAMGWIEPVQRINLQIATRRNDERDKALLADLRAAGMRLDDGEDHTGWIRKFISRGGGYYIDVGCSRLIVDGVVKVIQVDAIEGFFATGLRMRDGVAHDLDAVILATGFKNQDTQTREQFGDDVADRLGRVGGYDEEHEVKNTWRRTAQPGLWFGSGSIQFCRTFAPLVAMQLRAELDGLSPSSDADSRLVAALN